MEPVVIDPLMFSFFAALIAILLGIIAFFLSRLVIKVDALGTTLSNFDRDVTSKIEVLQERTKHTDSLYNRIRAVEGDITTIKAGGCDFYDKQVKDRLVRAGQ